MIRVIGRFAGVLFIIAVSFTCGLVITLAVLGDTR